MTELECTLMHQVKGHQRTSFPQKAEENLTASTYWMGFPGSATDKEPTCHRRRRKRRGFDPWVEKIPWGRAWQPTLIFLPEESHGQRSLASYITWGYKELNTAEGLILFTQYNTSVSPDLAFEILTSENIHGQRGYGLTILILLHWYLTIYLNS